ncbi:MAG: Molybdenum ABC transporter ATP-binding protein ModC [uncultured Friedmanniella sp.]|uniref:ABC-type quaternary amine transporter n=1 Tax=uncultured Friedmanniella sp. TaxID=335381 RepID=A0A6J4KZP5_9ACTN|nr:ABC transporter ATP-binding protein [uncultured Friedmanniella sp.]CAA9317613.1 MAG: Molybdenum ABC transporter ATP-binding protein ModC [uncultured Friedmanniella sp.]
MTLPALQVRGLRHAYGAVQVLHGVDLEVEAGGTLAVLGPSGCGKSTLLRLVAGFERPTGGTVEINGELVADAGQWVPAERRPMGYVAQEGSLFPHLSVRRNLEFGLDRASRRLPHVVAELLELVSLDRSLLDRYPHELSGGQQQRVALARTLARRPALVLFDEPFSALDADLRAATRAAVADALRATKVTTVLVTHDQSEALSFADTLAIMVGGRFTQVGSTTEIYERPVDLVTARLVGSAVAIPGTASGGAADTALGRVPLRTPLPASGPVQVMLRPEQITVTPDDTGEAVVTRSEYFGHDHLLELSFPSSGLQIQARVFGSASLSVGRRVRAGVADTALAFGG